MFFTSDLLYRFTRALTASDPAAALQQLEIAEGLSPVVVLQAPLPTAISVVAGDTQRDSFTVAVISTMAASAVDTNVLIATLGRGLWKFALSFHHHADFTLAPGNVGASIRLVDPAGNGVRVIRFPHIANVSQVRPLNFSLLVERDGWELRLEQTATGVAQTCTSQVHGVVARLT